jgi:hypothetical protein
MSRLNNPELERRYYSLFQREPYKEPHLTARGAISQTVQICFWMVVGGVFFAVLPSRHPAQKPIGWLISVVMALIGGVPYLTRTWLAWHNGPPGYRLVGEFEVREKDHLFSKCWVRLAPGNNFKVVIPPELYEQLQVGSQLRLTYTADGELVSLAKLG